MTPLEQLKANEKHYRLSAKTFHEDSQRNLHKANEALKIADEYLEIIRRLER